MRIYDRQPDALANHSARLSLPSYSVAFVMTCSVALSVLPINPAYAGWGRNLMHAVMPGVVKHTDQVSGKEMNSMSAPPPVSASSVPSQASMSTTSMPPHAPDYARRYAYPAAVASRPFAVAPSSSMISAPVPGTPTYGQMPSRNARSSFVPTMARIYGSQTDAPAMTRGANQTALVPTMNRISSQSSLAPTMNRISSQSSLAPTMSRISSQFPSSQPVSPAVTTTRVVSSNTWTLTSSNVAPNPRTPNPRQANSRTGSLVTPPNMALSTSSEGSPLIASAPVAFNPLRFEWTPRAALDYLPGDRVVFPAGRMPSRAVTQPLSNPLPAARPESVIAKPHSVVSAGALSPSLVSRSFEQGVAGDYAWDDLVAAGVFENDPLHGSVYKRKGSVKYIILHSTETANPADARRVILSWNNRGLKHPGAQFVVDRDGTICSTTDPDMVVIHIEPSRALAGYSNDNSIGIEIVRSGKQEYTKPQLDSVNRLVAYLQSHYSIPNSNVTTHHHVQPSDRSDPVNFDMLAFESEKSALQTAAIAYKSNYPNHSAQLLQIARAKRERALAAANAAAAARVAAANAAAARAAAANAATIVADEHASTADSATAAAAARRSDDLDDVLFPIEPEAMPVKSNADSTQYVSTMPKSAPDFRRRNKELILRD